MAARLVAIFLLLGLLGPSPAAADPLRADLIRIMLRGSRMSRTIVNGDNLLLPRWEVPGMDIRYLAENNFRRAVEYVVDHHRELPVNQQTAILLNKMVTEGLVPERMQGELIRHEGNPARFYRWLDAPRTQRRATRHPEIVAHLVHRRIGAMDAFPDGNGRTARLMADLVLLKAGRAPVLFDNRAAYLGSFQQNKKAQRRYFVEAARRGQTELGRLRAGAR